MASLAAIGLKALKRSENNYVVKSGMLGQWRLNSSRTTTTHCSVTWWTSSNTCCI